MNNHLEVVGHEDTTETEEIPCISKVVSSSASLEDWTDFSTSLLYCKSISKLLNSAQAKHSSSRLRWT